MTNDLQATLDVTALQALPESTSSDRGPTEELGMLPCWRTCLDSCYITCWWTD